MISTDSLIHFLKCQFMLYEIPFRVYKNGKSLAKFENISLSEMESGRENSILTNYVYRENDGNIKFKMQNSLMIDGAVYNRDEDLLVYVGTVRSAKVTEPILRRYLRDNNVTDLPDDSVQKLLYYINSMPIVAPALFLTVLSGINAIVNNEIIDPNDILEHGINENGRDSLMNTTLLKEREERYFGQTKNINSHDVESRFLFFVKNGMVKQLKDYCHSLEGFLIVANASNPDIWRIVKNRAVVAVALASRTAIEAGVSAVEADQLAEMYIQKVELCYSDKMLNELRYNMLVDFTERVSALSLKKVENYTLKKIMDYITNNLEDRLSLEDIAERFKINKNYLCKIFKEETGMGLTDFIQTNKVNMAKEMLCYTDKSIVEIANYLNFCSQSYFQKVFKKITGKTPVEFRNGTE